MHYNKEDILAFETNLYQEITEYQRKQHANDETVKMEHIL